MEEKDVKIGQRIVLTKEAETLDYITKKSEFKAGMRGKVIDIDCSNSVVLIEFDNHIGVTVRTVEGSIVGKDGHCWCFCKEDLTQIAKTLKRKNNY